MHCYLVEHLTQDETARRFRVSLQLVSKLVRTSKKEPEKLKEMKLKREAREERANTIKMAAARMLRDGSVIASCGALQ